MKALNGLLFGLVFTFVSLASATDLPQLVKVETDRSGGVYKSTLEFDREIAAEEYSFDFINETVQLNVPGAKISKGKDFTKTDDSAVKSLYTYQVDEDLLRHRIILKSGIKAADFENRVKLVKAGNKLIVELLAGNATPAVVKKEVKAEKAEKSVLSSVIKALPSKAQKREFTKDISDERKELKKVASSRLTDKEIADLKEAEQLVLGITAENTKKPSVKNTSLRAAVKNQESVKKEELAESEIPVLTKKEKTAGQGSLWRLVMSFTIILAVAGIMYFVLRRYRHQGLSKNKHTNIKVLTQHYLGPKKSLAIVSVAGESILVGITDQNINHIKTLSLLDEEIPEVTDARFDDTLAVSEEKSEVVEASESVEEDEFSMKGLKDLVSHRLKGMKDL